MNQNILRETDVTSIFLSYIENGIKKRYSVKLRFMDKKECYFAMPMPANFKKPKKKTPVEITAYTPDGVYTAQVTIIDSTVSMSDLLFNVTIPKTWKFKQLRQSSRKEQHLEFTVKYNDGFEISGETYDISVGGFSFVYNENFSSIYERLNCIITIKMPDNLIINFPDKKLVTEAKFVRKKENFGEYAANGTLFAYKYIKLSANEEEILKSYLLSLE